MRIVYTCLRLDLLQYCRVTDLVTWLRFLNTKSFWFEFQDVSQRSSFFRLPLYFKLSLWELLFGFPWRRWIDSELVRPETRKHFPCLLWTGKGRGFHTFSCSDPRSSWVPFLPHPPQTRWGTSQLDWSSGVNYFLLRVISGQYLSLSISLVPTNVHPVISTEI